MTITFSKLLNGYIVTKKTCLTPKSTTPVNTMLAVDENRIQAISKALTRINK